MAEHEHGFRAQVVVCVREGAPEERLDAEQIEVVRGHDGSVHAIGLAAAQQHERHGVVLDNVLDGREPGAVLGDFRNREPCVWLKDSRRRLPDAHQFVSVSVRQRLQEDVVDDRKDRGVGADPEAERQHGRQRVARRAREHAHAVPDVLSQVVPERGAADVADFFVNATDAAKIAQRRPARFVRRHSPAHALFDLHLEVERHLVLDLVVEPALPPGQPERLKKTQEHVVPQASTMRVTAAETWAQVSVSRASCFSPARVSR